MDMPYTVVQWVCFFFIYGFIGWCFESVYVSIKHKRWVNRGFMRGPLLPLYGSGAILLLFVTLPFRDSIFFMFLSGAIGATALEYVTGVTMEALFKVRYWDYSNRRFNFQGRICLAATTLWGCFAIIIVKVIHKPIENMVFSLPQILVETVTMIAVLLFAADFALSFKAALDIKDVLIKLEEVQREMERMQKRLDVILAFADDRKEQAVLNTYERLDELTDSLEERFAHMKELREKLDLRVSEELRQLSDGLRERSEEWKERSEERREAWKEKSESYKEDWQDRAEEWKEKSETYKEELEEMRIRFRVNMEKRFQLLHRRDYFRRGMLRNNPMMVSRRFKNALEDVKKAAGETAEDRKNE